MLGVNSKILFVINSFTLKSPLLTGELSSLISIFKPFENNSIDSLPALLKVSIRFSAMCFNSLWFISNFF